MSATEISFGVVALLVALAVLFDFMNGFHDAANSIATVVSTGVLKPQQAIVYGLTSDERWVARFGAASDHRRGWPVVLAMMLALAVGAGATMATVAFAAQRYFESRTAVS